MTQSEKQAPQDMQGERWAGELGDKWNAWLPQFEGMIAPAGQALLEHAAFTAGERVIDIGCGAGVSTLEIARRIGERGHATGLDLSETLVATAQQRAATSGLPNVDFVTGDASSVILTTQYDHLFSRFGIMFFADPVAAFQHMSTFLTPSGRMTFMCWGPPPQNPWVSEFMAVIGKYVSLPAPQANAPGPFAFADKDYLRDVLTQAGLSDIDIQPWLGTQRIGGPAADAEAAADFLLGATFVGEAIEEESAAIKQDVRAEIVDILIQHKDDHGIAMPGATWLVKAVR